MSSLSSSSSVLRRVAVAIDIDGVVSLAGRALPGSRRALELLKRESVPHALVTNGGGVTEARKAASVNRSLGFEPSDPLRITGAQMVLSHSPMARLARDPALRDGLVVLVGEGDLVPVAESYGFSRPITSCEYVRIHKDIYPFPRSTLERVAAGRSTAELEKVFPDRYERVAAVLVMHDPLLGMRDVQILCDVARSPSGVPGHTYGPEHHDPTSASGAAGAVTNPAEIHFSNPDLLFSSTFAVPRFGQGAFRIACEAVYNTLRGQDPNGHLWPDPSISWHQHGKPTRGTFDFAENLLKEQAKTLVGTPELDDVYMIGDNPAADIRGANAAGRPWHSVLVRTGNIVTGDPNALPDMDRPEFVVDNLEEAVEMIIEARGNNSREA